MSNTEPYTPKFEKRSQVFCVEKDDDGNCLTSVRFGIMDFSNGTLHFPQSNQPKQPNMNLATAIQEMTAGKKVKLPEWEGYWFMRDTEVCVFTKTGDITKTPGMDKYENRDDFEVCEPNFGFDFAIRCLKAGKKVARQGWNGRNMFIYMVKGSIATELRGEAAKHVIPMTGGQVIMGHIDMKAADGTIVCGWLASQTDMLSEDWVILS